VFQVYQSSSSSSSSLSLSPKRLLRSSNAAARAEVKSPPAAAAAPPVAATAAVLPKEPESAGVEFTRDGEELGSVFFSECIPFPWIEAKRSLRPG
jgi:hypothetical protein